MIINVYVYLLDRHFYIYNFSSPDNATNMNKNLACVNVEALIIYKSFVRNS